MTTRDQLAEVIAKANSEFGWGLDYEHTAALSRSEFVTNAVLVFLREREPSAEEIEAAAREHHDAYEELAPHWGYSTREASRVPWDKLPESLQLLMLASEKRALVASAQVTYGGE